MGCVSLVVIRFGADSGLSAVRRAIAAAGLHTQFFINGQEVTLAKLSSAALGATNKPLTIHFRLRDKVVTRVQLTVFAS